MFALNSYCHLSEIEHLTVSIAVSRPTQNESAGDIDSDYYPSNNKISTNTRNHIEREKLNDIGSSKLME